MKESQVADINRDLLLAVLAVITDAVPRDDPEHRAGDLGRDPGVSPGRLPEGAGASRRPAAPGPPVPGLGAPAQDHNGDLRSSLDAWNAQALTQDILTEIEATIPGK